MLVLKCIRSMLQVFSQYLILMMSIRG